VKFVDQHTFFYNRTKMTGTLYEKLHASLRHEYFRYALGFLVWADCTTWTLSFIFLVCFI